MIRIDKINKIKEKLKNNKTSIGTWMQIPSVVVAEIISDAGYDWIALDLEHGSISLNQLPELFNVIDKSQSAPLVRVAYADRINCSRVLDAGAAGLIIPMIKSRKQIDEVISFSCWPPKGKRGVGFSRANLYGKNFENYQIEAQEPIIIAQIEHIEALDNLEDIISAKGLNSVFLGPYDLSASMGVTGDFENQKFKNAIKYFCETCKKFNFPYGIHIVKPNEIELKEKIKQGYQFIAYSIDAVFLVENSKVPEI